ncbi:hypothetical protein D3C71_909290 [compost metagenome]
MTIGKSEFIQRWIRKAFLSIFRADARQLYDILTIQYPLIAKAREAFPDIDMDGVIRIRSRSIIDCYRRINFYLSIR